MSLRHIALPLLLAAALPAVAQDNAATASADWKAPKTPWGDPDLRGAWPIDYLSPTPRVRPAQFGTRAELNDEEYAEALRNAQDQQGRYAEEGAAGKIALGHWTERGLPLRQTSLMTLPADGRMPPATEEGQLRSKDVKTSWNHDEFNVLEDFGPFDRCISRGLPGSMLPGAYNMGIEVWQSPGTVAIRLEMVHEVRIVPLDGRGPPPKPVKNWLGYSVGHWEGDTLVIETTNFVPGSTLGNSDNAPNGIPNSEEMVMVERLTPTGPDTIRYQATIEDPVVLTAPFGFDFPWRRKSDYEQYEYACHEGNVQIRGYIAGTGTSPTVVAAREAAVAAREAVVAGGQ